MKRLHVTWNHPGAPDGYNLYLSKFGAPMAYEGTVTEEQWVINNIGDTDVLSIGIQPFVQTENGRIFGNMEALTYIVLSADFLRGPADVSSVAIAQEDV